MIELHGLAFTLQKPKRTRGRASRAPTLRAGTGVGIPCLRTRWADTSTAANRRWRDKASEWHAFAHASRSQPQRIASSPSAAFGHDFHIGFRRQKLTQAGAYERVVVY